MTWYHEDHTISASDKYILHDENGIYKLEVCNVTEEDEGIYRIHAQNKYGRVVCSCNLHVIGKNIRLYTTMGGGVMGGWGDGGKTRCTIRCSEP